MGDNNSDHGLGKSERFKQRFGIILCLIYAIVYAGFVFISVFNVELMDTTMLFGLNLSVFVGIASSVGIILAGPDMFALYGFASTQAWIPLSQPALLSMPLSFITIVTFPS